MRLLDEARAIHSLSGWGTLGRYAGCVARTASQIARGRSLGPADEKMRGKTCTFSVFGESLTFEIGERAPFGLAREIYGRRSYFPTPEFELRPDDVVVDLGANVGMFTVLAARLARRVVAVEAQRALVDVVRDNLAANDCAGNVSVECGLIAPGSGVFSASPERQAIGDPPVITMERLLEKYELSCVDFLKIDIEGSEFDLFAGDTDWLRGIRRIAMEVHTNRGSARSIRGPLEKEGFRATEGARTPTTAHMYASRD